MTRPPPEDAAQPQRDESRDHSEEQDVDVREALGHSGPNDARVAPAGEFSDLAR
jgi:hypothetical protein